MAAVQLATRIDAKIKKVLDRVCEERGLKMNRFVEEAILDKLEEMEDIQDLKTLRHDTFRPLDDLIAELKKNGKI